MKYLRTFIGFGILAVVFLLLQCFFSQKIEAIGEGLEVVEGQPLTIRAKVLKYEKNLVIAEGSVEITYRKNRLTADRVEFNEVTGEAIAIGNVSYREGAEILDSIKEKIQQDKVSLNNLGRGYLYTGKFEQAQKVLQKVLGMAPDFPDVHLNLGILAYKMRDYELARERIGEALKLDPENAEVHFNMGLTLLKLGRNEEMESAFRRAIYLDSELESAYLYLES